MQRRQVKLLPDLVHLLADDANDLVERAISQKKIRVNARSKLPDVARPHQKLMAGDLGIRRHLAQCWDK